MLGIADMGKLHYDQWLILQVGIHYTMINASSSSSSSCTVQNLLDGVYSHKCCSAFRMVQINSNGIKPIYKLDVD